ncbi:HET domain-containing protein [Colletotrichum salicis]|uniref:HET domain-containing protein n=1 Tax=Colletotrichum salicis TaxID=1209931 RepID=A0A135ST33_9PEZI|nr:HET domain-containing protein [Colletotrichum salicis]
MRLINVNSLRLEEFFDDSIPKYAILSHTWGKDEVTYQDLCWLHEYEGSREAFCSLEALITSATLNSVDKAKRLRQRPGFHKIVQSARLAKGNLYNTSGSIHAVSIKPAALSFRKPSTQCLDGTKMRTGWTLQELLAPRHMYFYNQKWNLVGDKISLRDQMSTITGIPRSILAHERPFQDVCLAWRMSWANRRQTSRKEDMAYCLLGLFNINMPLLYGEDDMAFVRLQQEIIKETTDQSLLAWGLKTPFGTKCHFFATSPATIARSNSFWIDILTDQPSSYFDLTNRGLRIHLTLLDLSRRGPDHLDSSLQYHFAFLNLHDYEGHRIGIPLFETRTPSRFKGDVFVRSPSVPVALSASTLKKLRDLKHEELVIVREPPWRPSLPEGTWLLSVEHLPSALNPGSHPIDIIETFPPMISVRNLNDKYILIAMPLPCNRPGKLREQSWQFFLRCALPEPVGGRAEPTQLVETYVVGWEELPFVLWSDRKDMRKEDPYASLADAVFSGARFYGRHVWSGKRDFLVDGKPLRAMANVSLMGVTPYHLHIKWDFQREERNSE